MGTWPTVICFTADGTAVQLLEHDYRRLLAAGTGTLTVELKPPAPIAGEDWYTVSDAARELLRDVDGLDFEAAKQRVLRGVSGGVFTATGEGRGRRIDPATFAMWLRTERRKAADREDEEELDERILKHRRRVEREEGR